MKASDVVARFLEERGIRCVFEMSGGMIAHLLDSLASTSIRIVSMHHEQSAAFAADAVGRVTGLPGVALATSGPGATNLLTGIGSAYFDSSPTLFITGQVNRHEQRGTRAIRQLGFQETDVVSMAKPITKAAWQVQDPEDLPRMLAEAFELSTSGRPGPVLIDIPMDVQRAEVTLQGAATAPAPRPTDAAAGAALAQRLRGAKRPLLLVGGGVRAARAESELRTFAERAGIPVVTSLMAVDALPYAHPLRVGLIGSYGNRWANLAIGASDLLIVLGSRLDVRQTGSETREFRGERAIVHVDCEPGEINNRVTGCDAVVSDLKPFLDAAIAALGPGAATPRTAWLGEIAALRHEWPDVRELAAVPGINPNTLMHQLSRRSTAAGAFIADVGQHQMWAAQSIEVGADQRFMTSGGMGSMGFALPAAIGVAIATAPRPVVVVAGDGGFQSNIQELQTVVRNRLPIKMVIVDNGCHGMVRQFQESHFGKRYQSTVIGYSAPDFVRIAEAYGIRAAVVRQPEEVEGGLDMLWAQPDEPALLQVMVATEANAYPKIAFGRPITEMEPFATPLGMEGT